MIEVAIPSRARADTLARKTLTLLDRLEVPRGHVRVFVAPDEVDQYAETLDAAGYRHVNVEAGAAGVVGNRNAITDFYPEGERYLSIDDDIRDLRARAGEKRLVSLSAPEFEDLVMEGFRQARTVGSLIWGLYPVPNPFFMKPKVRYDLCYVAGACFGVINQRATHRLSLEWRDDWERSLRCYTATSRLVRFEYITWSTEGYHGAGGLQTTGQRTKEATLAQCRELERLYPGLVSLNLTKKSGWPEERLRDRRVPVPTAVGASL